MKRRSRLFATILLVTGTALAGTPALAGPSVYLTAPDDPKAITIRAAGDGLCRLTLRELKERSFTLTLNADLLQALCSMLRATCEQSKWDLPLDYTGPAIAGPVPPPAKAPKARLH